jgi:hypothetical protein
VNGHIHRSSVEHFVSSVGVERGIGAAVTAAHAFGFRRIPKTLINCRT